MAKKQPYIPVYMGDDLRECGHLPLDVYGGYNKLRFALWDREDRGRMKYDMANFSRLMGADTLAQAENIVKTLVDEGVLQIEQGPAGKFLVREQMVEEHRISLIRKQNGSKGGSKTQGKRKAKEKPTEENTNTFAKPNSEAKNKQNPEYEYEVDIENKDESGKGGTGEKEPLYSKERIKEVRSWTLIVHTELALSDCLDAFLLNKFCDQAREVLCIRHGFALNDENKSKALAEWKRLKDWGEVYNKVQQQKITTDLTISDWSNHFANWLGYQNIHTSKPENYFKNGANNKPNQQGPGGSRGTNATATIERGESFG